MPRSAPAGAPVARLARWPARWQRVQNSRCERHSGPNAARHRRRRALLVALPAALLAAPALGAAALWWWLSGPAEHELQPGWTAVVATIAGDGVPGVRDGAAARARFSDPFGIAVAPDATLYVTDAGDAQAVRRIAPDGTVTTLAGGALGYADGPGTSARFNTPSGIAWGAGAGIYVADTGNHMIRRIAAGGIVSTVAGEGVAGYRDGAGAEAWFNGPIGIAVDGAGRVVVADTYNDRIRAIEPDGRVVLIAGSGVPGALDGPSAEAQFHTPSGVAIDPAGNIYVADTGNDSVRRISTTGEVSTVWPFPAAGLRRPIGIAVSPDGVVYVTDDRGRIVEIAPGSAVRTLAGSSPGSADGRGEEARLRGPSGLALVEAGHLVLTDPLNALVRSVSAPERARFGPPLPPRRAPDLAARLAGWPPLLWPFEPMDGPFEITGTLGEPRGGQESPRLHAGLDIRAPEGTIVRAVRSGVATSPGATDGFGSLNESVRIGPLTYVHLRVGRDRTDHPMDSSRFVPTFNGDGLLVGVRIRRGARFDTGDAIGTVNGFYHAHLNVGWPGEEFNPLRLRLANFQDTTAPRIARGGVRLFRDDGREITERARGRLVVTGRVRIVVDAWDQVDGNLARRRLGLYKLGYQVLNGSGDLIAGFETPRETIRFDRMPAGGNAASIVYGSGSGIPFYGGPTTRFYYVVTSTLGDGTVADGVWDTAGLAPGDYTLRIIAEDIAGNRATANSEIRITLVQAAT